MTEQEIEDLAEDFDDGARDGWKFSEGALLAFARALLSRADPISKRQIGDAG